MLILQELRGLNCKIYTIWFYMERLGLQVEFQIIEGQNAKHAPQLILSVRSLTYDAEDDRLLGSYPPTDG
jgi:hypothetical protein